MLVKHAYNYISGDIWKAVNAEILQFVETNVTEDDLNPGFAMLTTNVSGCSLSIFLLFLFGLGWGPVLSLLLWSLSMVTPIYAHNTMDVTQTLILDVIQVSFIFFSPGFLLYFQYI